ncbi:hypothetical protein [Virgibacillus sp. DJP39]|uniref:hypothetical protein n=1 Tax=Virgibacillus sp. DJP39 TaxID=3409790 RepID=UPI003BB640DF
MKQPRYGLLLFVFLILPPVANLLESIMIVHMHMQLPLLVIAGFLMAPFFQTKFSGVFRKWNSNGIPGIALVVIIWSYWMIPRMMDEALTIQMVEIFKFISLPFLVGVPLRDSWKKIGTGVKDTVYILLTLMLITMAWIYIGADQQICNNYLLVEQQTVGWGSLAMAGCLIIYFLQLTLGDRSEYE